MERKKIIAHRGASAYEKENSIESFTKAVSFGADMIEFDVRETSDGVLIAYHDASIKGREIKNISYKDLLELSKKNEFNIPKVEEIVESLKGKIGFQVHLKYSNSAIKLAELMKELVNDEDFMIISDHIEALKLIKDKYPKITIGYILFKGDALKFLYRFFISRIAPQYLMKNSCKCDFEFVIPDYHLAGKRFLLEAKRRGCKVLPWTINRPAVMLRFLKKEHIYGISTDKPDVAMSLLNKL